jgi:hypothetical protein
MNKQQISFGDNVRIRMRPVTEKLGVAGKTGSITGEISPSVTGVQVIGDPSQSFAFSVELDDRTLWIAPDLLELVDHAPGKVVMIDAIPKKWIRAESGKWVEELSTRDSLMRRLGGMFKRRER